MPEGKSGEAVCRVVVRWCVGAVLYYVVSNSKGASVAARILYLLAVGVWVGCMSSNMVRIA